MEVQQNTPVTGFCCGTNCTDTPGVPALTAWVPAIAIIGQICITDKFSMGLSITGPDDAHMESVVDSFLPLAP